MKRFLLALLLLPATVFAQAHPRAIMTPTRIAFIEAKAAADSPDWLVTESACNTHTQNTAGTPDSMPPVYASREPITSTPPGYIYPSYQGFGYFYSGYSLGVCYFAVADADPPAAAKYKAQALKVARAMSVPFATVTAAVPPSSWQAFTSRPAWYVSNDGGGNQVRVRLTVNALTNGATVTISGVTGCTEANTTGKVAEKTVDAFDLVEMDGVTPVTCASPGTNYNHNFASDAGYPIRVWTVLSTLYDWFQSDFTSDEKTWIYNTLNGFSDEFRIRSPNYANQPMSNYHAGFYNALGLTGILTRGVGENPRGEEMYALWNTVHTRDSTFFDRWAAPYGGFPEAIRYQALSMPSIAWTMLADWEANGVDHFANQGLGEWVLGLMKYWVHNTLPPRAALSYRGYIASPVDATGTNPNPWFDVSEAFPIVHHIATLKSDSFRTKFKDWMEELAVQNGTKNGYIRTLFWDADEASEEWTSESLTLPQLANPSGKPSRVTMRSDWTTSAVYADFWAGPAITDMGNGKERSDKGSLHIHRGDDRLLISGAAEATRHNSTAGYNAAHGATYNPYGIWFPRGAISGTRIEQKNASSEPNKMPGWTAYHTTTQHPAKIDRHEDAGEYVYSRGVNISEDYTWNGSSEPAKGWDREVFYLRPKVFVVYDRTFSQNRVSGAYNYHQEIVWMVGKTPVTSAYGSGMYRTEVSDGATYKGGLTYVLPADMADPAATTTAKFSSTSYEISTRQPNPAQLPDLDNKANWLTVVDAADASGALEEVALFATRSNADVIRVGDDTVIGFPNYQTVYLVDVNVPTIALPITYTMTGMSADNTITHYLCGLTPSTTYERTVSGNDVTIAVDGSGGTDTVATAAGCVEFTSTAGGGGNPDVVVTTTDPMPAGQVGVAYNQCLAAAGGDGGPYTYAVDSGAVPSGTSLTAGCVTGTPDTAETASFDIVASDGALFSAPKSLTVTIAANPPVITETPLPNGVDDVAYSTTVCATGGVEPYVFTVSVGTLPTGLTLNTASPCATITGTPTVVGTTNLTLLVTDDDSATDTWATSIQVTSALTQMGVSVQPGSNAVLVVFGAAGLPAGLTCTIELLDETGILIQTNNETLRFARQRSSFRGLSQLTNYGVTASCPGSSPGGVVSFTTAALVASDPVAVRIAVTPSAIHPTVTQATLRWGISAVTENSDTIACTTGCTFTPDLSADIYVWQVQYKNAGGTVLATTNSRELIVK